MRERIYHLYAHPSGPYEIVPTGFSPLAAVLGGFWAYANGLLGRYLLLTAAGIPLIALGRLLSAVFVSLAGAYWIVALLYYFPSRAFAWRASGLEQQGFKLRARLKATSSAAALRKYAEVEHGAEA